MLREPSMVLASNNPFKKLVEEHTIVHVPTPAQVATPPESPSLPLSESESSPRSTPPPIPLRNPSRSPSQTCLQQSILVPTAPLSPPSTSTTPNRNCILNRESDLQLILSGTSIFDISLPEIALYQLSRPLTIPPRASSSEPIHIRSLILDDHTVARATPIQSSATSPTIPKYKDLYTFYPRFPNPKEREHQKGATKPTKVNNFPVIDIQPCSPNLTAIPAKRKSANLSLNLGLNLNLNFKPHHRSSFSSSPSPSSNSKTTTATSTTMTQLIEFRTTKSIEDHYVFEVLVIRPRPPQHPGNNKPFQTVKVLQGFKFSAPTYGPVTWRDGKGGLLAVDTRERECVERESGDMITGGGATDVAGMGTVRGGGGGGGGTRRRGKEKPVLKILQDREEHFMDLLVVSWVVRVWMEISMSDL